MIEERKTYLAEAQEIEEALKPLGYTVCEFYEKDIRIGLTLKKFYPYVAEFNCHGEKLDIKTAVGIVKPAVADKP